VLDKQAGRPEAVVKVAPPEGGDELLIGLDEVGGDRRVDSSGQVPDQGIAHHDGFV
jgi:hypothetical protein